MGLVLPEDGGRMFSVNKTSWRWKPQSSNLHGHCSTNLKFRKFPFHLPSPTTILAVGAWVPPRLLPGTTVTAAVARKRWLEVSFYTHQHFYLGREPTVNISTSWLKNDGRDVEECAFIYPLSPAPPLSALGALCPIYGSVTVLNGNYVETGGQVPNRTYTHTHKTCAEVNVLIPRDIHQLFESCATRLQARDQRLQGTRWI